MSRKSRGKIHENQCSGISPDKIAIHLHSKHIDRVNYCGIAYRFRKQSYPNRPTEALIAFRLSVIGDTKTAPKIDSIGIIDSHKK